MIEQLDDATIVSARYVFARMDWMGRKQMSEWHGGRRDKLEIHPKLWPGVGLARGGAGAALVVGPDTVAERIDEYRRIGADAFIFSGYPRLGESHRVAEWRLPRPPLKNPVASSAHLVNAGPFGEILAGAHGSARASQS